MCKDVARDKGPALRFSRFCETSALCSHVLLDFEFGTPDKTDRPPESGWKPARFDPGLKSDNQIRSVISRWPFQGRVVQKGSHLAVLCPCVIGIGRPIRGVM